MALINLVWRRTTWSAVHLLSLRVFISPPASPFPFHYSPVTCTWSPNTALPINRFSTRSHFPNLNNPLSDASDFEEELDEAMGSADNLGLHRFLEVVERAKGDEFKEKCEALAFLRECNVKPTSGLVLSAIWELRKDWKAGILAFKWGEECVKECPWAWHLMIWALGKQRKFNLAWSVLRRMRRWKLSTRRALLIMMERYVAANESSKALKTFHIMEKITLFADSETFYTLLRVLCKYKNVEEAEELLFSDRKLFPLETEGFNIILNAWCNIMPDVVEAKRIWREMSNYCIYPDGTSYTHMICCFSKVGNLFDSLRLYDEMKKRGWTPGLSVYNSLLYVLTKENCINDAHSLYNKMAENGLKPDVNSYNSFIVPLCEAQKLDEAQDMLKKMTDNGMQPNVETYHAFIEAESLERTLDQFEEMRNSGNGPTGETFNIIFDKFFRLNQPGYALRLWTEMARSKIIPEYVHYNAVVRGLLLSGWIPKAWEYYKEMKCIGFPADPKLEKFFKEWKISNKKTGVWRGKLTNAPGVADNFLGERIFC